MAVNIVVDLSASGPLPPPNMGTSETRLTDTTFTQMMRRAIKERDWDRLRLYSWTYGDLLEKREAARNGTS